MPRFLLTGDILKPGQVIVVADTISQALELAQKGEFEIADEQSRCLSFEWGGEFEELDDEHDPEAD